MRVSNNQQDTSGQALGSFERPNKLTRYAFYALVFAFPWEALNVGLGANLSLTKLCGFFLFGAACLQPKICFRFPPKAFWLFVLYFFFYALLAIFRDATYDRSIVMGGFSFAQLLVLFWLSFNLMRDERVVKGFLLAFIGACLSLTIGAIFIDGVVGGDKHGDRLNALGQNPNTTGATLALGLVALLGLAYGRQESDTKNLFLALVPFLLLGGFMVMTGSRGAMLSFAIGIAFFVLKGGNIQTKIGLGLIAILGGVALVMLAFQFSPQSLERIERSAMEGEIAGRDVIYIEAAGMVNEKPLIGWGPVRYRHELAKRVGYYAVARDPHNLILKLLLEVGILGAIPFFLGIGSCAWAAWKARGGPEGSLPLSILVTLLMLNMSHTWDNRKIFWIILAYALVSARYAYLGRRTEVDLHSRKNYMAGSSKKTSKNSTSPVVVGQIH